MNRSLWLSLIILLPACLTSNNFNRGYLESEYQEITELPFTTHKGLILITASFNGVEGKFLFDNGASLSCINQDFAKRSNIRFNSSSNISDGNNRSTQVKEASAKEISIGPLRFKQTGVYLIDTRKFFPCYEVDGIIGASIINKVNWLIDFESQTLKVSTSPFSLEGTQIPFGIANNNSSFMEFGLNDLSIKAKVDFGYQGDLKLRSKEYKAAFLGYQAEKKTGISSLSVTGLGKPDTTYEISEGINMHYKEKKFEYPPEVILTKNLKYKARIGIGFFKNYQVAINSNQKRYILQAYQEERSPDDGKAYAVDLYKIEDRYKVIQFYPDDPQNQDLSLLEEVMSIDGKDITEFQDFCYMRNYLSQKRKNQETLYLRFKSKNEDRAFVYKQAPQSHIN